MSAAFFVPGRIEVLGKHTDYAGGRSLLCAIDRGIRVEVVARGTDRIRITDAVSGETIELDPAAASEGIGSGAASEGIGSGAATGDDARWPEGPAHRARPAEGPAHRAGEAAARGWRIYPATVVRRAARDFGVPLRGCDIVFESDLPAAAGLSSSTALVSALFLALDAVSGLRASEAGRRALPDDEALASYLSAVERGSAYAGLGGAAPGVGIRGGGEDHVAVLCGVEGALVRYSFEPTRFEGSVPIPAVWSFAVASSGVRAEKSGAARDRYNRLSDLAARAASLWRDATGGAEPHLGAILRTAAPVRERIAAPVDAQDEAPLDADTRGAVLDRLMSLIRAATSGSERDALLVRVEQFALESETIVPAAAHALAAGDTAAFRALVERSQAAAERLLGNQVAETIGLVHAARDLGAAAASAFGAGFGGAVWALVRTDEASAFLDEWQRSYEAAFPVHARESEFFITRPGPPARPCAANLFRR